MPTVLRLDGLRVTIYPNDHRPAHVPVIGAGREAVFDLHCPNGPPELRENYGIMAQSPERADTQENCVSLPGNESKLPSAVGRSAP
jgi:hypothetical protein